MNQNKLSFRQYLCENLKTVTEGAQEVEELFYNSRLLYFLESVIKKSVQFVYMYTSGPR